MPIKTEQVTKTGLVVSDFDNKLNTLDIKNILNNLPNLEIKSNKNPFIAKYRNKTINLCVRNISYLGIPHPLYKKRIQIPKEWKEILQQENTLLLGIYSYKKTITFCLFDTHKYKQNKLNNSSAHIYTIDLHKAREIGVFKKTDKRENNITVFTEQNFHKVFNEVLFNQNMFLSNELSVFNDFSKTLHTQWHGIHCYKEMINAKFNNAYQSEWAGFYLEHKFKEFISNNPNYAQYCQYIQDKTDKGIDLDLWFGKSNFFGDLKAHTINKDLAGNDKKNIYLAVKNYGKVWYIAFVHNTVLDKNLGVVTRFWNTELNKRQKITDSGKMKKLDSYLSRMKNSITLDHFVVLEINQFNVKYLSAFNQGKNSDGKPRKQKILIKNKDIKNDNFAIFRRNL